MQFDFQRMRRIAKEQDQLVFTDFIVLEFRKGCANTIFVRCLQSRFIEEFSTERRIFLTEERGAVGRTVAITLAEPDGRHFLRAVQRCAPIEVDRAV